MSSATARHEAPISAEGAISTHGLWVDLQGAQVILTGASTLENSLQAFVETATSMIPRKDVTDFLKSIVAQTLPRRTLTIIYDRMDRWMSDGIFEACDAALRGAPLDRLSNEVVVGLLASTLPARPRLRSRAALVSRARSLFDRRGLPVSVIDELLDGLG